MELANPRHHRVSNSLMNQIQIEDCKFGGLVPTEPEPGVAAARGAPA
jgi:hypothetical protein